MKRTNAEGHVANRYTEGNPSLGQPATVVGAEEMNNLQEEIVNVVLAAGLTLDGATENQLLQALNILIPLGGSAPVNESIDNNITSATSIAGLLFSSASVKSARIYYDIHREDSGQRANESGELFITHDSVNGWALSRQSVFDDAEVVFTISPTGQIQYTSSNYTGGSYAGTLRASVLQLNQ